MMIMQALNDDLPKILELQYLAYQSEAELLNNYDIPPLKQTLPDVEREFNEGGVFLKALEDNHIVGSVRGKVENGTLHIGKLIVRPDRQGQGLGTSLLAEIERICPHERCELFTSAKSRKNIQLYQHIGYKVFKEQAVSASLKFIYLEKR